jgi:hypothetical protein
MPNDFFAKRLAAIEQEKARRLGAIEEEEAPHADANRFNRVIPLIVDCIKKMWVADWDGSWRLDQKYVANLQRSCICERYPRRRQQV